MVKRLRKIFDHRFSRFYRYSRLYIVTDIVLIAIVVILAVLLIRLYSFQPELSLNPWSKPKQSEVIAIDLNNPPLDLSYESEVNSIYLSEGANINLRLKNNGRHTLSGIKLTLALKDTGFSLSRLEFSSDQKTSLSGLEIKGFNIYLDELNPGVDREVALNISFSKTDSSARIISARIYSEYQVEGQIIKESLDLKDFKVAASLPTSAKAYYNSPQGDQLGSGPFPPIVGLPTSLWVSFETKPSSDFNDFVMTGRLATNVEFSGNKSLLAGDLKYNKDTRQVIWQIDNLSASKDNYRAGFEIKLSASESQLGDYANLLSGLKFQARDHFSGLPIYANLDDIDTSLKYDAINREEGIVTNIENY